MRYRLIRLADLDLLEGLNGRYQQLMLRLEAAIEEAAAYDRPPEELRALQAEVVRLRREAVAMLELHIPQEVIDDVVDPVGP